MSIAKSRRREFPAPAFLLRFTRTSNNLIEMSVFCNDPFCEI